MATLTKGYRGPQLDGVIKLLDKHGFWPLAMTPASYNKAVSDAVADFQATALGENKKPLDVDGDVGPMTMWSLRHYGGDDQKLNLPTNRIPKGLTPLREAILREYLLLADAGVKEQPRGSNRSPEIDNLLPKWWTNKYGAERPKKKGPAWCCFAYMSCFKRASGRWLLGRIEGSCKRAAQKAKQQKKWAYLDPIPGDAAVILRDNGTGHMMVVYRVSKDGKTITTIEGNVANRVGIRERKVSSTAGFIRADDFMCEGFQRGLVKAKKAGRESTR